MRRLTLMAAIVAAAILGTALSAQAQECLTVEIVHEPHLSAGDVTGPDDGSIRTAVVGHFIWFQWGHQDDPDSNADDILSFDVTDVALATACLDGTVSLVPIEAETETPAPAPVVTKTPEETVKTSVGDTPVEDTTFDMDEFLARLRALGLMIE